MKLSHLIACVIASLAIYAGMGAVVGLVVAIGQAHEGDKLGNCHVYGDGKCGDMAPWHGFTGAAPDEPLIKCARGFVVETINGIDHISCADIV